MLAELIQQTGYKTLFSETRPAYAATGRTDKVFKALKTAQMKKQADCNDFAFGHCPRPLGRLVQDKALGSFVKIFAELVYKTKNIANFSVVNHVDIHLNVRYLNVKIFPMIGYSILK